MYKWNDIIVHAVNYQRRTFYFANFFNTKIFILKFITRGDLRSNSHKLRPKSKSVCFDKTIISSFIRKLTLKLILEKKNLLFECIKEPGSF